MIKIITAALVILFILLQYKLWFAHNGISQSIHLKQAVMIQAKKNDLAGKKNQKLIIEIRDLKTGNEAAEDLARSKLGLIKSDETYYRVVARVSKSP